MAANKKLVSTIAAVATSAALLLGGTLAWQSANQTALNEASDVVNPGGRLHDDFFIDDNGDYNADIYVENFAEEDIFARVKLQEYMEVIMNYGTPGQKLAYVLGSKSFEGADVTDKPTDNVTGYDYEYVTHYGYTLSDKFEEIAGVDQNDNIEYWTWTMGSPSSKDVYYIPTFNMNKDSLVADRNGMYVDRIGGISNRGQAQYEDWKVYAEGDTKDGTEIWDIDYDTDDEVGYDFENLQTYADAGDIKLLEDKTHNAKLVGKTMGFISMDEWLAMLDASDAGYDADTMGSHWVYDDNGWIYWSSPIKGGDATGLLLDSIELNNVMDDTWYYAINAIAQFVTADDVGKTDDSGFYRNEDPADDPDEDAERFLEAIGVDMSGEAPEEGGEDEGEFVDSGTLQGINMSLRVEDNEYIKINEATNTLRVNPEGGWQKVFVDLEHDTLDINFGDTNRAAYEWDDANSTYTEHHRSIVDINYYPDGLDLYLGNDSSGRYKVTATYGDDNGNTYKGSIEFTIEVYEEPEEPEDPYGFSHLLMSFPGGSESFNNSGYLTPGDQLDFDVVAYYQNGEMIPITSENVKWSVSAVKGELDAGTTIGTDGLLTVSPDQADRSVLNVKVTFTDKDGVEHYKDMSILVSTKEVTLSITINDAEPYYTGRLYSFTASAINSDGETVPMEWTYDMGAANENEFLSSYVDESGFVAYDAGEYYLHAWAEYMPANLARVTFTAEVDPASLPVETEVVTIDGIDFYVMAEDAENNRTLLLAKDQLSGLDFLTDNINRWDKAPIRTTLNNEWLPSLPTLSQCAIPTLITTPYGTDPETQVQSTSKVFLLSEADVFGTSFVGTSDAKSYEYTYNNATLAAPNGSWTSYNPGYMVSSYSWALRSYTDIGFASVDSYGQLVENYTADGIRPALWITSDHSPVAAPSWPDPTARSLSLNWAEDAEITAKCGDPISISYELNGDSEASIDDLEIEDPEFYTKDVKYTLTEGIDYTYDRETHTLVFLTDAVERIKISSNPAWYSGYINLE